MWAATDIYRTRITSSMNHLRQQIEAAFYMNLVLSESSVAEEWFNINTENEGKKFFNKYRKNLAVFLDKFNLANSYNRISGTASHARISSVMYGLEVNSTVDENKKIDKYKMKMQEIIPERQEAFILNVLAFLNDQQKLFDAFLNALPEIDDPLLLETRIPSCKKKISFLYDLFNKTFPNAVSEIMGKPE